MVITADTAFFLVLLDASVPSWRVSWLMPYQGAHRGSLTSQRLFGDYGIGCGALPGGMMGNMGMGVQGEMGGRY